MPHQMTCRGTGDTARYRTCLGHHATCMQVGCRAAAALQVLAWLSGSVRPAHRASPVSMSTPADALPAACAAASPATVSVAFSPLFSEIVRGTT